MFEDSQREVIPSSIAFNDVMVEIAFLELKDQSERAGLLKTLVLDRSKFAPQIESLMDDLIDLIDAGLLEIRSPAPTLDPRKRIGKKKAEEEAVEDNEEPEG